MQDQEPLSRVQGLDEQRRTMNESKKNYDIHYVKTKCKQYTLLLSKENDKDIIEFLESQTNRNGFLKQLIRAEMKKEQ